MREAEARVTNCHSIDLLATELGDPTRSRYGFLKMSILEQIEKMNRALKSKDLEEMLALSKATISREVASGRLSCFRIGSSLRFDPKSVADWLRSR